MTYRPESEQTPDDNDFSALEDLDFGGDIAFTQILDSLKQHGSKPVAIQEAYAEEVTWKLQEHNWLGSVVRVSGKLRLSPDVIVTDFAKLKKFERLHDDRGYYVLLDDDEIAIAKPSTDATNDDRYRYEDDSDGPLKDIVFGFSTVDDARLASPGNIEDVVVDGDYMMYPDDIYQITFSRLSDGEVRRRLLLEYSDIAAQLRLEENEAGAARSDQKTLQRLKEVRISSDRELPPELMQGIGRLLYKKLNIRPDIQYQISAGGTVFGIDHEGLRMIPLELAQNTRITSTIVAIDMMSDGNEQVPGLITAEASASTEGFEAVLVPVSCIEKLAKLRQSRARFGETAVRSFTTPAELYDYWVRFQQERVAMSSGENAGVMQQLENDFKHVFEPYIDTERNLLVQPMDSEVSMLFEAYDTYQGAPDSSDRPYELNMLLDKTLDEMSELSIGDMIEAGDGVELLYIQHKGRQRHYASLDANTILTGQLKGIVEAVFPAGLEAKQLTRPHLSLVLAGAETIDGDTRYDQGLVFIKIPRKRRPHVSKLLPINNSVN